MKAEAAELEYNLLKTRDEEEKASITSEIAKLKEENQLLANELKTKQTEFGVFQENRDRIFSLQEKEIQELREENERLRNERYATIPNVPDTSEKSDENVCKEDHPPVQNATEKNEETTGQIAEETMPVEDTPDHLSRRLENLMVFHSETKKSCKKVNGGPEESLHPSLMKSKKKGKKAMGRSQGKEEDEGELTMKGNKCTRRLFTGNDFDDVGDLESSFVEVGGLSVIFFFINHYLHLNDH